MKYPDLHSTFMFTNPTGNGSGDCSGGQFTKKNSRQIWTFIKFLAKEFLSIEPHLMRHRQTWLLWKSGHLTHFLPVSFCKLTPPHPIKGWGFGNMTVAKVWIYHAVPKKIMCNLAPLLPHKGEGGFVELQFSVQIWIIPSITSETLLEIDPTLHSIGDEGWQTWLFCADLDISFNS